MGKTHHLKLLADELHTSVNALETGAGLSQGSVGKVINGKLHKLSPNSLRLLKEYILSEYGKILNEEYALTGKKPMFLAVSKDVQDNSLLNKALHLFGLIPEQKRDGEAFELLEQILKDVKDLNNKNEELLARLKKLNSNND